MDKLDIFGAWQAFLHWKGWISFARFCGKLWKAVVRWNGWRRIFSLPFSAVVFLCLLCCAGLVWVFVQGYELTIPAYILYALSAYSLISLCIKIPSALRREKQWVSDHPQVQTLLNNEELKFSAGLVFEQVLNFVYGIFKTLSGILIGSAWVGCDGIYNLAQAFIQLFQILKRRRKGTLTQQWRSYRVCGVLILLMHLTLTGIVFQMVTWHRAEEHGEIMVIATAAFAFYKIIHSFWDVAKDRKHAQPMDSSVRMLNLSQAFFAIFSLQASMLHTFGAGDAWEGWLNLGSGCTVCLLVASMGIYMIRRGTREIQKLQETDNG